MIKEINKGEQFLCIKDFFMEDGKQSYTEGEIYTSDITGSIEDNQSDSHYFLDDDIETNDIELINEHFKKI